MFRWTKTNRGRVNNIYFFFLIAECLHALKSDKHHLQFLAEGRAQSPHLAPWNKKYMWLSLSSFMLNNRNENKLFSLSEMNFFSVFWIACMIPKCKQFGDQKNLVTHCVGSQSVSTSCSSSALSSFWPSPSFILKRQQVLLCFPHHKCQLHSPTMVKWTGFLYTKFLYFLHSIRNFKNQCTWLLAHKWFKTSTVGSICSAQQGFNEEPYFMENTLHNVSSILRCGCFRTRKQLRPHPHRMRKATQSKWDLLVWMGVSTLHTSNIKGFAFKFACSRPVWIGPEGHKFWIGLANATSWSHCSDSVSRGPKKLHQTQKILDATKIKEGLFFDFFLTFDLPLEMELHHLILTHQSQSSCCLCGLLTILPSVEPVECGACWNCNGQSERETHTEYEGRLSAGVLVTCNECEVRT